jgi:hypothetical protein
MKSESKFRKVPQAKSMVVTLRIISKFIEATKTEIVSFGGGGGKGVNNFEMPLLLVFLPLKPNIKMKWSRDHVLTLGLYETLCLVFIDLDSSGSVIMKIDAKVCFPRGPSGGKNSIGSKFGIAIAIDCT